MNISPASGARPVGSDARDVVMTGCRAREQASAGKERRERLSPLPSTRARQSHVSAFSAHAGGVGQRLTPVCKCKDTPPRVTQVTSFVGGVDR